jgi:O-antigen/teichoic acid export membrane protein
MVEISLRSARRAAAFLVGTQGTLKTRVFRSGAWVAGASIAQNVMQTGRSIVLARLLPPEAFGLMGLCLVVIRGLDLFTETGFGAALIQRQENVERAKDTVFTLQVMRGVALTCVAWFAAPFAAAFYEEPALTGMLRVLAVTFTLNGFSNIGTVLLEKRLDFRKVTTLEFCVTVISTIVVVVAGFWLRSVWAIVIGHVVMIVSRLVLSYVLVPGRPRLEFDRTIAGELFRYGRFITALTIVLFLTTEADNLIVGKILGFELLGYYTMAYMLANLPATHFAKVASRVLFPAYSALQSDPRRLGAAYLTVLRLIGGVAIPAAVGLSVLATEITTVVYGPRWLPAAPALRILAVFGAMRAISSLGGYVLQAIGKPNINFYLVSGKLVVILALLPWLTSHYGIEGAALAVTLPQIIGDTLAVMVVKRYIAFDAHALFMIVGRIVLASGVMTLVILALRQQMVSVGPVELLQLVVVGIIVYGVVSFREIKSLYVEHLQGRFAPPTV